MASVHHTIEAHVATVVLSNEARMNAMSLAMWRKLAETLAQLQANPDVRVVVLRGEGERAFVAGADISEFDSQRSGSDKPGIGSGPSEYATARVSPIPTPRRRRRSSCSTSRHRRSLRRTNARCLSCCLRAAAPSSRSGIRRRWPRATMRSWRLQATVAGRCGRALVTRAAGRHSKTQTMIALSIFP
jgi:hypothetical protein